MLEIRHCSHCGGKNIITGELQNQKQFNDGHNTYGQDIPINLHVKIGWDTHPVHADVCIDCGKTDFFTHIDDYGKQRIAEYYTPEESD